MTINVRYIGPAAAVVVDEPFTVFVQGETVAVDDEHLAAGLLVQDTFDDGSTPWQATTPVFAPPAPTPAPAPAPADTTTTAAAPAPDTAATPAPDTTAAPAPETDPTTAEAPAADATTTQEG